jgi:diguanylate cyclase (GGDEF)-like protein
VYLANIPSAAGLRPTDTRRAVLHHTLSITTAGTEEQLLARTLEAVCGVLRATVAVAVDPTGVVWAHGEPDVAAAFVTLDPLTLADLRRTTGPTRTLARIGLPSAIAALLDQTLVIGAVRPPGRLDAEAATLLPLVLAHAAASRVRLRELASLTTRAESDPLTGLRHRRPFQRGLAASRPGRTAVIAIDMDRFKQINDEYGHLAGDRALVRLADAMRAALRDEDQLYRIGGDEFAVIVDVNGPAEASAIAQRLIDAARRAGQTISAGTAVHARGETGVQLLARADMALYEAKRAGRDRARLAA